MPDDSTNTLDPSFRWNDSPIKKGEGPPPLQITLLDASPLISLREWGI